LKIFDNIIEVYVSIDLSVLSNGFYFDLKVEVCNKDDISVT